jgi:hypothetical protein
VSDMDFRDFVREIRDSIHEIKQDVAKIKIQMEASQTIKKRKWWQIY